MKSRQFAQSCCRRYTTVSALGLTYETPIVFYMDDVVGMDQKTHSIFFPLVFMHISNMQSKQHRLVAF